MLHCRPNGLFGFVHYRSNVEATDETEFVHHEPWLNVHFKIVKKELEFMRIRLELSKFKSRQKRIVIVDVRTPWLIRSLGKWRIQPGW